MNCRGHELPTNQAHERRQTFILQHLPSSHMQIYAKRNHYLKNSCFDKRMRDSSVRYCKNSVSARPKLVRNVPEVDAKT
jgi:hypothetical protein